MLRNSEPGNPNLAITRFAPSPTGRLHLGHAYSALFAERAARDAGGRFLLRIEDIDPTRCRPEFTGGIFEDLQWLGLVWPSPVAVQSERMGLYAEALKRLKAGGFLYPCFCTRKDIAREVEAAGGAPHGAAGTIYPGTCRKLSPEEVGRRLDDGEGHAWRLDVEAAVASTGELTWEDREAGVQAVRVADFGDVVLARKEMPTSYHLAVTVDDADQGISLVTRGTDLFESTPIHRLLQALLQLPVPIWHHHALISGPDGKRYAKRDRSVTLQSIREGGRSAAEVRRELGF